ncbi:hypothetical protein CTAYLR_003391 [Chrysophaeum taylorii]|uniref:P-type ATPase A domain-containing protein n=1 Tax=Chrysophaeum taylorii TaxID=2483200 RepID=A0AAD7UA04_9STRA|nr:hypothetical protein CTAYLR_003391 [Chrysophaeum taylorii]
MHLQHDKDIASVTVHRESRGRRLALLVGLCVLYAASVYSCVATAGKPYARALAQGKALESLAGDQKLKDKAAAHAAAQQRLKAQKLANSVVERNEEEDDAAAPSTDDDGAPKASTTRQKAEKVLEQAAQLAQAMIDSANRGENKTEEELKLELFGDDELSLDEEEESRPLPSKYLPDAWACLFLFATMTAHALFFLMCHWIVSFKARSLYVDSNDINNKCHLLIVPQKHKGRAALVPVKSSKLGGGLVVEYQRQLYEYWGPEDDDAEEDDVWAAAAAAAKEDDEVEDDDDEGDEEEEVVVVEEDDVVGYGRENGSLRRVTPPLRLALAHYAASVGLDSRSVLVAAERYGQNVVEVKVPSFVSLYKEQLLSPIAMFQVFTSLLWLLDSYWQYVGFTLFSIVFMEAGTVVQRQRTLKSLSGMSAKAAPVFVWRDAKWQELQSDDLLPGDLISVSKRRQRKKGDEPRRDDDDDDYDGKKNTTKKKPKATKEEEDDDAGAKKKPKRKRRALYTVPCDCLLLRGSAVANEATLTGESTPQMKDSLTIDDKADDDRALEVFGRDRVSVLFSGTELVNASAGEGSGPAGVPEPPDAGAIAFVLRTGFASAQGELMQMIEFSQQSVSSDTRETLLALLVLLIFALVSAAYVLKRGLEKGDRTTHELLLRCVIIVTSVVPRQLPMQMALAVNTALMALMKAGIMATEPFRVPYAGRVRHCLFDKTGTLTTDRLSPVGVICFDGAAKTSASARQNTKPVSAASDAAALVIAACHSLVSADTGDDDDDDDDDGAAKNKEGDAAAAAANSRLVGDPIELTALRALGWSYDAKTATAAPPSALVVVAAAAAKSGGASRGQQQPTPNNNKAKPSAYRRVRIVSRYHFSSALQRMSVVAEVTTVESRSSKYAALVKGSPEAIKSLLAEGTAPAWYDATYASLAERGMRVLALSYKWLDDENATALRDVSELPRTDVEAGLLFCGFIAFECRTRADSGIVCKALADSAHRVAMVTGDAPLTALHVARTTHIVSDDAPALLLAVNDEATLGAEWVSPHAPPRCESMPFDVSGVDKIIRERGVALVITEAAMVAAAHKAAEAAAAALPVTHPAEDSTNDGEDAKITDAIKAAKEEAEESVWSACAARAAVFARMSPQGKARICRSLQRLEGGACVLMCGDGGNDVGALKQADVGVALLAGYGDANTTGHYADVGEKLAKGRKKDAAAEDVLNAQAEALADARERGAETRKKHLANRQKELMAKQREWIEEELARRAEKGDTGIGAQFGAVKSVAMRLRKEMAQEVDKIDAKLGNVYDNSGEINEEKTADKSPQDLAAELLGSTGDEGGGLPMIRPGDASVAAPFTSRAPSIRAVVDLIRQGRCTLLSSLQQQQIMVLESVISAYTLAALSLEGARSSERQMMASGWLLIVASMAFSYATPLEKMSPSRPIGSLFDPSIVVSVAGQGAIHIFCMRQAVKMATERMGPAALDAVVKFQRRARSGEIAAEEAEDDVFAWFTSIWSTPFLPNLLNTAVFLVETSQMIAVLLVNYKGRPWMKGLLENHALFLSLFISIAGLVLCAWNFVPMVNQSIHLAPFPDDLFRFKIAGLVAASLAGTFVWDRLSTALFAPKIFRAMLDEAKATTVADLVPVFLTAAKVVVGALLLAQGNLVVLAGAAYFYRSYSKQQAAAEKERKARLVAQGASG